MDPKSQKNSFRGSIGWKALVEEYTLIRDHIALLIWNGWYVFIVNDPTPLDYHNF
jgi:hypothetical protein